MRNFLFITISALFLFQFSVMSVMAFSYDVNSPEVKEIASKFSMQGHADHDISNCQTKQTYFDEITELLNDGKTKEEILDYYYKMYGEEGLRAPNKSGFSLLAWTTPYILLGIAGVSLLFGIRRITRKHSEEVKLVENSTINEEVKLEIVKSVIDEERKKLF